MLKFLGILTASLMLAACSGNGAESQSLKMSGNKNRVFDYAQNVEYLPNMLIQPRDLIYSTRSGHAEFYCEAYGTVGIFMGESGNLNGMIDFRENAVELSLDLNTLKTGIAQRDPLVYETLDVERHPVAAFSGTFEPSFDHDSTEKQAITATGLFTIHGVTRELNVEGYLQNQDSGVVLQAEWIMDITDYGISTPRIYSVKISDEQEIRIEARLQPQLLATLSGTI